MSFSLRRALFAPLLLVPMGLSGWVGCSSSRTGLGDAPRDFGTKDAATPEQDGGCSGLVCSRDLRSIRDCTGNVVKECSADTACGNGECVAPCEAAALNEGSVGCSFAIPTAVELGDARGACSAIFVANDWNAPVTLHVSYNGEERSLEEAAWVPYVEDGVVKHRKLGGPIPPGGGAVVFIANEATGATSWIACPEGVTPILDEDPAVYGSGVGHAIFATTDLPVSMYSIYPYGGAASNTPSGMLLLPTTSFRKNYILTSAWGGRGDGFGGGVLGALSREEPGKPTVQILAVEDDTSVALLPRVDIEGGGGIKPSAANQVMEIKLGRGELLQLAQQRELVGSVLEASKPVAVFGGHTCMDVPVGIGVCDSDNEQIPPLSAWGHEYAVLPAPDRVQLASGGSQRSGELSIVRIVGAADGTELVYEPSPPEGAPRTLAAGQLARFFVAKPFVVRSQDSAHPFLVATVMTGMSGSKSGLGDPETAIVSPTDQWLDSHVFFADYTYARSAIYVTRRRTNGVFYDVMLDCAGAVSNWQPITDDYEWAYVELSRAQRPTQQPAGECADGPHRIKSEGPFTFAVWGVSRAASYSYAGGMGLRRATALEVPVR